MFNQKDANLYKLPILQGRLRGLIRKLVEMALLWRGVPGLATYTVCVVGIKVNSVHRPTLDAIQVASEGAL